MASGEVMYNFVPVERGGKLLGVAPREAMRAVLLNVARCLPDGFITLNSYPWVNTRDSDQTVSTEKFPFLNLQGLRQPGRLESDIRHVQALIDPVAADHELWQQLATRVASSTKIMTITDVLAAYQQRGLESPAIRRLITQTNQGAAHPADTLTSLHDAAAKPPEPGEARIAYYWGEIRPGDTTEKVPQQFFVQKLADGELLVLPNLAPVSAVDPRLMFRGREAWKPPLRVDNFIGWVPTDPLATAGSNEIV